MELNLTYPDIEIVYSLTKTVTISVPDITVYQYSGGVYNITYETLSTEYSVSIDYDSITTFNGRTAIPTEADLDIIFTDFIDNAVNPPAPQIPTPVNIQDVTTEDMARVLQADEAVVTDKATVVTDPVSNTTLVTLAETLQEVSQRLAVLASVSNAGNASLRVTPVASVSTAVSGSLTTVATVTTLTNFGANYPAFVVAMAETNETATMANINNVTT